MRIPTKKVVTLTLSTSLFLLVFSLKANNVNPLIKKNTIITTKLNSFKPKNITVFNWNDYLLVNENKDNLSFNKEIKFSRTDKGKLIFQIKKNGYLRNQDITISTV